jgi:hypothetical protein
MSGLSPNSKGVAAARVLSVQMGEPLETVTDLRHPAVVDMVQRSNGNGAAIAVVELGGRGAVAGTIDGNGSRRMSQDVTNGKHAADQTDAMPNNGEMENLMIFRFIYV